MLDIIALFIYSFIDFWRSIPPNDVWGEFLFNTSTLNQHTLETHDKIAGFIETTNDKSTRNGTPPRERFRALLTDRFSGRQDVVEATRRGGIKITRFGAILNSKCFEKFFCFLLSIFTSILLSYFSCITDRLSWEISQVRRSGCKRFMQVMSSAWFYAIHRQSENEVVI